MGKGNEDSLRVKHRPIKFKILAIILPVITLAIGGIIGLAFCMSSNIIEKNSYNMLDSSAKNQTIQIENWLHNNLKVFNTIKQSIGSTDYSEEGIRKILNQYYNFDSSFPEGLYVSDMQGKVIVAEQSKLKFDNALNTGWFNEGLTHINMRYGIPYKNSDGAYVVSATGLIVDNGEPVGVIGGDLTLNRISVIINSLIDMEDAQAFLVDKDTGMVLASSDALEAYSTLDVNNSNKFYSEIAKKIDGNDYHAEILCENIVTIKEISDTNWILVSYAPESSIFELIYSLRNYMIILAVVAIGLIVILIERTISLKMKPINEMSKKLIKMSDGDFTINIDVNGNDEISLISNNLNKFITSMRSMLNNIKTISAEERNQSEESNKISSRLFELSKKQTDSMKYLNSVVEEVNGSTGRIADTAENLADIVSETTENGNMVKDKMYETVKMSENGKKI